MCTHCHLATPGGDSREVCHACAIAVRSEARQGLAKLEDYLVWSELERWLSQEE